MSLTDAQCKTAQPKEKTYRLSDSAGLYLEVTPSGSRYWRMKYRFAGKEKRLAFGVYPEISLKEARLKRDDARKLLSNEVDPGAVKKAQKASRTEAASNSFEAIAREWYAKQEPSWAPKHSIKIKGMLQKNVFPWVGSRPIREITAPDLLAVLRRAEGRGAVETAHRIKQTCGQVFRYAVATGRAERDPTPDLKGALAPRTPKHLPSITDPSAVGPLLRAIDGFTGTFTVKSALKLAPLIFVRPGELRQAEWSEMDLDAGLWSIPAERMKTRQPHLVPLCKQAVEILRELQPLTGRGRYVFPGARTNGKPLSDNTLNAALRRMGIGKDELVAHGFRAMARTILDEVLGYRIDWIEHQLAHAVRDTNGRAYNRTAHLDGRKQMMQGWADYLDSLKSPSSVVPLRRNLSERGRSA